MNVVKSLSLFGIALSLDVLVGSDLMAQSDSINTQLWVTFDPPKEGTPYDTTGGASRGTCPGDELMDNESLSSLMPSHSETDVERPSFAVYLPKTGAKQVFFSLKDADEDYFYQTQLPLPKTPGTYRLELPTDAPAIDSNIEYQWSIGLICGQAVDPNDPRVSGMIRYRNP
ncbi:MAG: DUF928 domain-containing protein [Coleofasciculus sp. C2-GNP5-27]